jgi:hypothetical protein
MPLAQGGWEAEKRKPSTPEKSNDFAPCLPRSRVVAPVHVPRGQLIRNQPPCHHTGRFFSPFETEPGVPGAIGTGKQGTPFPFLCPTPCPFLCPHALASFSRVLAPRDPPSHPKTWSRTLSPPLLSSGSLTRQRIGRERGVKCRQSFGCVLCLFFLAVRTTKDSSIAKGFTSSSVIASEVLTRGLL